MANEEAVSSNIRIAGVLEQIGRLDKMIAFHKANSPDDAMLKQYQYLRQRYSRELVKLMKQYNFQLTSIKPKTPKVKQGQARSVSTIA